jgi:hypothetical protein
VRRGGKSQLGGVAGPTGVTLFGGAGAVDAAADGRADGVDGHSGHCYGWWRQRDYLLLAAGNVHDDGIHFVVPSFAGWICFFVLLLLFVASRACRWWFRKHSYQ